MHHVETIFLLAHLLSASTMQMIQKYNYKNTKQVSKRQLFYQNHKIWRCHQKTNGTVKTTKN